MKVIYEKRDHIAYVSLNRPEQFNAIDREVNTLLHDIWIDFKNDRDLFVAILSGQGNNFCAGFDLKAFHDEIIHDKYDWSKSSMFGNKRVTPNEHGVFKPVITAVEGIVNGAGTLLMLQGDIRIAAEKASIGLGEVRLNFPVEFSSLITRYLPLSISSELLYTAQPVSAERLYQIGIINHVVSPLELMPTAERIAKAICKGGQESIQVMKELLIKGQYLDYEAAVKLAGDLVVPVVNKEETRKAVAKFVERKLNK